MSCYTLRMRITIASIKRQVLPLCRKYDLKKLALFGSQVKGNIHKDSDIDLLAEPPSNLGLIRFAGIQLEYDTPRPKGRGISCHPELDSGSRLDSCLRRNDNRDASVGELNPKERLIDKSYGRRNTT